MHRCVSLVTDVYVWVEAHRQRYESETGPRGGRRPKRIGMLNTRKTANYEGTRDSDRQGTGRAGRAISILDLQPD